MVSVTITYKNPGTQPPIFVAGSFSDPEWQPQEMYFTTDDGGEHTFYKDIEVLPSSRVQYKFRVGPGDWWVLNEDAPTITDASGNRNNCFTAPESQEHTKLNDNGCYGEEAAKAPGSIQPSASIAGPSASQLDPMPKAIAHVKDEERQRLSSTPIEQVADTAAEVADTAAKLDSEEGPTRAAPPPKGVIQLKDDERRRLSSTPIEQVANVAAEVADSAQKLDAEEKVEEGDDADDAPPPLFAHEALAPYEPVGSDDKEDTPKEPDHHGSVDYDVDKYDLNDPTLERWPSNRSGIIDAVRNVETGLNEDQTTFHGVPLSPIITSRKAGLDQSSEDAVISSAPSSPGSAKKLELPRKSYGSMVSDQSLLSLSSIAEEDKETPNDEGATREADGLVRVPSPAVRPTPNTLTSPASDEDEGVVMKGTKARSKTSFDSTRPDILHMNGESNGESSSKPDSKHAADLSPKTVPTQSNSPAVGVKTRGQAGESSDAQGDSQAKSVGFSSAGPSSATGRDDGHRGQVKKRGTWSSSSTDRPGTPSSIYSVTDSKGGWLQAFFRVLFVDWIGGLFSRLFGSKRKAMVTSTATIVVGVAWWRVGMDGDLSWVGTWLGWVAEGLH